MEMHAILFLPSYFMLPQDTPILLNIIQKCGSAGKNTRMSVCQEEMCEY